MNSKELFLKMVRISVGTESAEGFSPSVEEWQALYAQASRQTLLSALSPCLDRVSSRAPLKVYTLWMLATEKIQKSNALSIDRARELYERLIADGLRCCILKGHGNASYYPDPTIRQSGDIDIWVDGSREDLLKYFRSKYKVGKVHYHHFDASIFKDVDVEVHTTPSWMNSPSLNRKMQAFIEDSAPGQFSNFRPELGFAIPALRFNVAHSIFHIFRHFFSEGIGLRQPMDLFYQLKALGPEERGEIMACLERLSLGRFTAALMYAMQEVFLLPDEYLLCAPDASLGRRLAEEMLCGGNFGKHGKHYRSLMDRNLFKRAASRTVWVLARTRYCPQEALWAPLFKFWQRFFITKRYA